MHISRADQSTFLDSISDSKDIRKAFGIERLSHGTSKIDPFEGQVSGDIWKITGKKLYKREE